MTTAVSRALIRALAAIVSRTLVRTLAIVAFVVVSLMATSASPAVVVRTRTAVAYRPVYHPVARTAAVVGTAVAVGAVVATLPPHCAPVIVGNVSYQQCGSTWYRPAYSGTTVSYTVVNAPR
jgi:hypothetical protein